MPLYVYPEDRAGVFFYAVAGFGRWLWRYRSELTPIYWTAGIMLTGAWLHAVHPHWWAVPAALAVTAPLLLTVRPTRRRMVRRWPVLARRGVRVWVGSVSACTGAWLTAATITGISAGPLRLLGLLTMFGLGAPWWWNRDRRTKVRIRRVLEHFPDTAEQAGLGGAQMLSAVIDPWGWTARLRLRRGHHAKTAVDAVPALESALGTRVGAVRIEPVPSDAAEVVLRVVETDPHAKPIGWPNPNTPPQPGTRSGNGGRDRSRSIAEPVRLGVWEDGAPVRVSLLRRHALIGGTTGSGKSGVLNVILADLSACGDVVLWGVDLKGGTELTPWRPCLARVATTKPHATELLRAGVTELDRRAEYMAAHGLREWVPSRAAPALVIVVDEYAELHSSARPYADSIARRGRAVAVTLLVATQRPTQKAMGEGTAIRSQMDVRVCLRVRERGDADLILGQGMHAAGWDATALDAPGKFLLSAPGHITPRRGRAYLITDDQITNTAKHNARPHDPTDEQETARQDGRGGSGGPQDGAATAGQGDAVSGPDVAMWAALWQAGDQGATVAELVNASGLSRPSVYRRLQRALKSAKVTRLGNGRWRAAPPPTDPNRPTHPGGTGGTGGGADGGAG